MQRGREKAAEEVAKVVAETKRNSEWEAAGIIAEAKLKAEQIITEAVANLPPSGDTETRG